MKATFTAVLAASIAGSASAETFRFPADRINTATYQVDIAMSVYTAEGCERRWSLEYPAGFIFVRGGPNGGNLRGNPGRGSYDIGMKFEDCLSKNDYFEPAKTRWHKVIVY